MKNYCKNCATEITNKDYYTVKLIDYKGDIYHIDVCSEKCGRAQSTRVANLHNKRSLECIAARPILHKKEN